MKSLHFSGLLSLLLVSAVGAGSGPLGHVVMARHTIAGIRSGQIKAPAELRSILSDPDVARAYCGGAIGPDLDDSTHYKKTSEIPTRMIAAARADLAKANASHSVGRIKAAKEELAFAYGWLNHCAADLNIHPVINAMTGDTFRYNGAGGKATHAEVEAEFTAFLAHGQTLPSYDPIVPAEFVARTAFMSTINVASGVQSLALKAKAERAFAENRGASPRLTGAFRLAETGAMADNSAFLRDPRNLKNWDLDCGRITTADFETLREATMRANGGKLPSNWGSMYLTWNERTSGLTLDKKIKIMAAILGGAGMPVRQEPSKPVVDKATIPKGGAWVLERTEFTVQKADPELLAKTHAQESGADGLGTAQATFGHPDPNIFVTFRVKVAWTSPPRTLIPGKTYPLRFAIFDAGSDDNHGLFLIASGSLGTNCPAMGDVWPGPAAGVSLNEKRLKGEATRELTPRSAPNGTVMVLVATWTVGIRSAYFTYFYTYRAK